MNLLKITEIKTTTREYEVHTNIKREPEKRQTHKNFNQVFALFYAQGCAKSPKKMIATMHYL